MERKDQIESEIVSVDYRILRSSSLTRPAQLALEDVQRSVRLN